MNKEKIVLSGQIFGGNLHFENTNAAKQLLNNLESGHILVTIESFKNKRSVKQNKYYWGTVIEYVKNFHYETFGEKVTNDDIHAYHVKYISNQTRQVKEIFGEPVITDNEKRTSRMTAKDFIVFIDEVLRFWAERDLYIPKPEEKI